jgi:hypothetical protein
MINKDGELHLISDRNFWTRALNWLDLKWNNFMWKCGLRDYEIK